MFDVKNRFELFVDVDGEDFSELVVKQKQIVAEKIKQKNKKETKPKASTVIVKNEEVKKGGHRRSTGGPVQNQPEKTARVKGENVNNEIRRKTPYRENRRPIEGCPTEHVQKFTRESNAEDQKGTCQREQMGTCKHNPEASSPNHQRSGKDMRTTILGLFFSDDRRSAGLSGPVHRNNRGNEPHGDLQHHSTPEAPKLDDLCNFPSLG